MKENQCIGSTITQNRSTTFANIRCFGIQLCPWFAPRSNRSSLNWVHTLRIRNFFGLYTINKIKPRSNTSSSLTDGSILASTNSDKANLLNKFFSTCFNDSKVPCTYNRPEPIDTSDFNISTDQVRILLSELDPSSSTGSWWYFILVFEIICSYNCPSLSSLFNLSVDQSIVPSSWKLSNT